MPSPKYSNTKHHITTHLFTSQVLMFWSLTEINAITLSPITHVSQLRMVVSSIRPWILTIQFINKSKTKSLPSPLPISAHPAFFRAFSNKNNNIFNVDHSTWLDCWCFYSLCRLCVDWASKQAKLSKFSTGLYSVQIISFSALFCRFYQPWDIKTFDFFVLVWSIFPRRCFAPSLPHVTTRPDQQQFVIIISREYVTLPSILLSFTL